MYSQHGQPQMHLPLSCVCAVKKARIKRCSARKHNCSPSSKLKMHLFVPIARGNHSESWIGHTHMHTSLLAKGLGLSTSTDVAHYQIKPLATTFPKIFSVMGATNHYESPSAGDSAPWHKPKWTSVTVFLPMGNMVRIYVRVKTNN